MPPYVIHARHAGFGIDLEINQLPLFDWPQDSMRQFNGRYCFIRMMISHLIDEAIRYSVGSYLEHKDKWSIITAITTHWIRPHGPMKLLLVDQESGLLSDESAQWLSRWMIELKTKDGWAHADVVERHHALLDASCCQ